MTESMSETHAEYLLRERERCRRRRYAEKQLKANMTPDEYRLFRARKNAEYSKRANKERTSWTHEVVFCHKRVSVLWPGCAEPDCVSITMFKTWTDIPAGTVVMLDGKLWNKPYRVTKKEATG